MTWCKIQLYENDDDDKHENDDDEHEIQKYRLDFISFKGFIILE